MPTLTFTAGNDVYEVLTAETFTLNFLAGNDTLTTRNTDATTTASMGEGADVVNHRGGTTDVTGGAGADRFEIYAAALTAHGGADNDLFNIRTGNNHVLDSGLGNDRFNFYGNVFGVTLNGGDGADDFFGYGHTISGNLYGDGGNDYFVTFSGSGAITALHGGAGNDIYRYHPGGSANFIEEIGEGTDSVQVPRGHWYTLPINIENMSVQGFSGSIADDTLLGGNSLNNTINAHNNIDRLFGYTGNDRLFGKGADDVLWGGDGNDYLDGGPGNDEIHGDGGDDVINGRAGDDNMAGSVGNDVYYVDSAGDVVTESAGWGTDLVRSTIGLDLEGLGWTEIENVTLSGLANVAITGNALANELTGNGGDNFVNGGLGNDAVRGGGGEDSLFGGDGDDVMQGGDGDDTFNGGAGADSLSGGLGEDTLTGGTGADTFEYNSVAESTPAAADAIADHQSGVDVVDLSTIDANTALAGNQAFVYTADTAPVANSIWRTVASDGSGGYNFTLFADVNGDAVADFQLNWHTSANIIPGTDIVL